MKQSIFIISIIIYLQSIFAYQDAINSKPIFFYDSCGLYYSGPYLSHDQNGNFTPLCKCINQADAVFIGTFISDTSYSKEDTSKIGNAGLIKYKSILLKEFRINIDSLIKGYLHINNVAKIIFLENSSEGSYKQEKDINGNQHLIHFSCYPKRCYTEHKFNINSKALFAVNNTDTLLTPIFIGNIKIKCIKEYIKCLNNN